MCLSVSAPGGVERLGSRPLLGGEASWQHPLAETFREVVDFVAALLAESLTLGPAPLTSRRRSGRRGEYLSRSTSEV